MAAEAEAEAALPPSLSDDWKFVLGIFKDTESNDSIAKRIDNSRPGNGTLVQY